MGDNKHTFKVDLSLWYEVPENMVDEYKNRDFEFYESLREEFWKWKTSSSELRVPIQFELKTEITE